MENNNNDYKHHPQAWERVDEYLKSFPPGYKFVPRDDELIEAYLLKKINNEPLPVNRIHEVDVYKYSPNELREKYGGYQGDDGEKFYFFTPRARKYRHGTRPDRAAGDGYWKASGVDKKIITGGVIIGYKRKLVFYRGKATKTADREKTNWIMNEFTTRDTPAHVRTDLGDMTLDECVLAVIHQKKKKKEKKTSADPADDSSANLTDDHVSSHGSSGTQVMINNEAITNIRDMLTDFIQVLDPEPISSGGLYSHNYQHPPTLVENGAMSDPNLFFVPEYFHQNQNQNQLIFNQQQQQWLPATNTYSFPEFSSTGLDYHSLAQPEPHILNSPNPYSSTIVQSGMPSHYPKIG